MHTTPYTPSTLHFDAHIEKPSLMHTLNLGLFSSASLDDLDVFSIN